MRCTVAMALFFGFFIVSQAHAQSAQVDRGMKVFAESKCSMCHAVAGKGNAKGVLDGVGAKLSAADIRNWLTNPEEMRKKAGADRKPLMKSFASLSKDDLDALVAYLQTLKAK